jgi:prostaglandin-endoperoxide synthase 2
MGEALRHYEAMPGGSAPAVQPEPPRARDVSRDGLRNRIEAAVLTGLRPAWQFVNRRPALARLCNRAIVNISVLKVPARPLALSTAAAYTSWPSLTDRTWFGRYLPPRAMADLPPLDEVMALFKPGPHGPTGPRVSPRSTLLFPSFAQWFTDGFLMTNDADRRRTTTNHQIDLGQLYGLHPEATQVLRRRSEVPGQKGRLKSVVVGGEEWAPRLYDAAGRRIPEFAALPAPLRLPDDWPAEKRAGLFAFGGDRANTTPFTAMLNMLFLREHNRLCGVLERAWPDWDDARVFETARNVNIVQLIKIAVEEYVNHISPYWFNLLADPAACYKACWNRQNWIPVEFNLLYRWHSLVPERVSWAGRLQPIAEMRLDNRPLLQAGLGAGFDEASRTKAWRLGLFNTADFLLPAEQASIAQGRANQLASYNDYRAAMGYPRVTRFEQISGDPRVVEGLRRVYGDVDRIEFFVGLLAEDAPPRAAVPGLIGRMVGADAFSHALTNPLLAPAVFNEATFSPQGMQSIGATSRLQHLLDRNAPGSGRASMEQEDAAAA